MDTLYNPNRTANRAYDRFIPSREAVNFAAFASQEIEAQNRGTSEELSTVRCKTVYKEAHFLYESLNILPDVKNE